MTIQPFEFATANSIHFGVGKFQEIGRFVSEFGKRVFVIIGFQNEYSEGLKKILSGSKLESTFHLVEHEPTISAIQTASQRAEEFGCDLIIGMGGGSAIDTAKAIAILMNNPGEVVDYLEVIGKGKTLPNPSLPCIAVPTTAGTGAEVTRNAVIGSPADRVKVSLRSPYMLPKIALVDPELTLTLPPMVTASTGMDALTQVIEPFVSNKANPLTDTLCKEGVNRAARSLKKVYDNGADLAAREDLCLTSLFGGLALANAKLGAVHGFAGVIGGMFNGPHGAICARLLPPVIAANVKALRARQPHSPALQRYEEIARILTGDSNADVQDGVQWIEKLGIDLGIPPLSGFGMDVDSIQNVAEKSAVSSSMQGNPIQLTLTELIGILEVAL